MTSSAVAMGSSIAGSLANMIGINTGSQTSWELREKSCFAHQMKSFSKFARRRLPITSWITRYKPVDLLKDSLAGLILGFTLIPQSIVFASVANVPLQYGLYSSIVGHFLYCLFGTVREMSIGPSAVMGLLISDYSFRGGAAYTVLLCFLSGCVELLFAVLNLGFLIDFISAPVNCGFSSAAAVMITAKQLRLLGHYSWSVLYCCITFAPGRNVIIVTVSAAIAYYLSVRDINVLTLTAGVDAGLPVFHLPPFSIVQNNVTHDFIDMCKDLGPGIFLVPVLSILQHLVVAKVFFRGKSVDDTQEILALGGIILLALQFLTPYFNYIPQSALASMVICAVIFMLNCNVIIQLWKASKMDSLTMLTTFLCCIVMGAEYGILVGIALSLAVLLYSSARPNILIKVSYEPPSIVVQPDRMLNFPAVEYVRYKVIKIADQRKKIPIIVDGSHLCGMDFTVAECVRELMEEFQNRKQLLVFTNLQKSVIRIIKGSLLPNFNYFPTVKDAENKLREGITKSAAVLSDSNENTTISSLIPFMPADHTHKTSKFELKNLGSDCSDPYEHTAWFNLIVSIPRLKVEDRRKSDISEHNTADVDGCDNCECAIIGLIYAVGDMIIETYYFHLGDYMFVYKHCNRVEKLEGVLQLEMQFRKFPNEKSGPVCFNWSAAGRN
uniref:STAS domain-containing protein n=1 Tax=Strigamia maritima TaxID=126957 RepID=T1IX47_STRMM